MKILNIVFGILLFASYSQYSNASPFQSPSSIKEATRQFIASNLTASTNYKLKLGSIDSRLKLPACEEPLKIFTHKGSLKPGRNSIGVKCDIKKKWTIYTSAIIKIYENVITLSQPVRRGDIYSKSLLQLEKREISELRSGFFTDPQQIINKQATRSLNAGAVITRANITEPKLIKRGEKVTIKVNSPNLEISVAGIALMDGIQNQNIRIKNISTQQIVQATVVKQGLVVVTF